MAKQFSALLILICLQLLFDIIDIHLSCWRCIRQLVCCLPCDFDSPFVFHWVLSSSFPNPKNPPETPGRLGWLPTPRECYNFYSQYEGQSWKNVISIGTSTICSWEVGEPLAACCFFLVEDPCGKNEKTRAKWFFSRQKGIRFQRSQVWVFKWNMNLPRYQGDSDFERIGTMLATKVTLSCWWDVMGKWKKKRVPRCGWHDWDLQGKLSQIHCIQIHMYLKIH